MNDQSKTWPVLALIVCAFNGPGAAAQPAVTEPGDALTSVWHLGRVTGDLDRIVSFYCDIVGLGFRGDRSVPITFYSVATINEFTGSPPNAEFRAAFLPIPGSSPTGERAGDIYLEALEYRHIDRQLRIPRLSDIGVTSLRFVVDDIEDKLEQLMAADITVVTVGGGSIEVAPPPGYSGRARAVLVRDPDGYPVEFIDVDDRPSQSGADTIGAQMTLIVADLDASLDFLEKMTGSELTLAGRTGWSDGAQFSALRSIEPSELRSAAVVLPESSIVLELIELRGVEQDRYEAKFQDIGFGHVAFRTGDIERVTATLRALGARTLSESGSWTQINDATRAVYTQDPNGLYIEVIE